MEQTFATATLITMGVIETLKRVDSKERIKGLIPVLTLALGFLVSYFLLGLDLTQSFIVGLSANGTYSVIKPVVKPTADRVEKSVRKMVK